MEITPLRRTRVRRLAVVAVGVLGTVALAGCADWFPPPDPLPEGCPTGEVVVHVDQFVLDVHPGAEPGTWEGEARIPVTNDTSATVAGTYVWADIQTDEGAAMVALSLPESAPGETVEAVATYEAGDLVSAGAPSTGPVSELPSLSWADDDVPEGCPAPSVVAG